MTGNTDGKKITIDGNEITPGTIVSSTGTGIYLYSGIDGSGNLREKYAVILYVASGSTLGDATKLHVYDEAALFVNDEGKYYSRYDPCIR